MVGIGVTSYYWLPRKWDMDKLKRNNSTLEGFGLYNLHDEFSLLYLPYDLRGFLDTTWSQIMVLITKLVFRQLWQLKNCIS
jgi:hypothetical protein